MRYLIAGALALALACAGSCAADVWKVATVHGLFQYEISSDGTQLLFLQQPRNDNGWFWWNNNGSPYGALATGGLGPNGYRDGSRTFAMSSAAAGQKLSDLKLAFTYYNPWGHCTINFFITDGRGRYGIFAPTSAGIGAFAQYSVNEEWTTITLDLTNTSIPDSTSVAVYEHNGLKAEYGEPYTTFTWGEIKNYTIAGMYDYQRSPHYGWGAWAEVFGQINSSWTPFVIRTGSSTGNPPAINDVVQGGVLAKEFLIIDGGQKAAWGTRMLDGKKVRDIAAHILRLDDTTRFSAGSGPAVAPYINIWVTDGRGKFAVIANEPSNPEWTSVPGSQWNFDWGTLETKTAKAYENSDKTWLPKGGDNMVFSDLADYTILPPTPEQLSAGWPGLGGGAPRELGTNKAYGFNWVFGDTLSNYVSGDPGYVVARPDVRKDAPALVNGYGVALIWGDTVGNNEYVTGRRWIKEPVITFGSNKYQGVFQDSAVPNLLYLTPETIYAKPHASVVLGLYQANLQTPVAGYQAFLGFDSDKLGISVDNITLTGTPYALQLMRAVASGEIDLAAGVNYGQPGTTEPAQLATLTFTAGTTDGVTRVTFRDADPPTRFTDEEGNEVRTAAVESGDIVIDGTPPVDVTISASPASWTRNSPVTLTFSASDALAGIDHYKLSLAGGEFVPAVSPYDWDVTELGTGLYNAKVKAVDRAGNSAEASTTVYIDKTAPTISIDSAKQGGTELIDGPNAIQGVVDIYVTAADAHSGLTGVPTVTVTPSGGSPEAATWVETSGTTYHYTWTVTSSTPNGTATINASMADNVGNVGDAIAKTFNVNKSQALVSIHLESVTANVTRWIKFTIGGTGGSVAPVVIEKQVAFVAGAGTATLTDLSNAGAWTRISAKDEQHTLQQTVDLVNNDNNQFTASFTGTDKLIGGDLTNDNLIDILDFGVFAGQYGTAYHGPYTWPARDADISCDGQVGTADFSYIQSHFLARGDLVCGGAAQAAPGLAKPTTSIRLRDLSRIIGAQAAYAADLNKDGIIDVKDVRLFVQRSIAGAR